MGVLNATPDSFSDGGMFIDPDIALAHARSMREAGADIIDIGGESTRPGADSVSVDEEAARVIPLVEALAADGIVVSIDTSKPEVARFALDAGAAIVNDVTGLRSSEMIEVVSRSDAGVVIMHMLGSPRTMQVDPQYDDVVGEVRDFLLGRADAAIAAGIEADRICIDPGIGFGKTLEHNLDLLANLDTLAATGHPVLIGASRKSFITKVLGDLGPLDREIPTVAAHVLGIGGGARVVRAHDVRAAVHSARLADAIVRSRRGGETT